MATISVRVDEQLKQRMEAHPSINWSEVIREAIGNWLERDAQRNLAKAVLITERIRKEAPEGFNSTELIREWRQRR